MVSLVQLDIFSHQNYATSHVHGKPNEDAVVAAGPVYAVVDGATDRNGVTVGSMTGAAYTAHYLQTRLSNLAVEASHQETEASRLLAGLNRAYGKHLQDAHPAVHALGRQGPCAAAMVVKLHEDNTYSYAGVGDAFLVEIGTEGHWFVMPDQEKPGEKERIEHFHDLVQDQGLTFDEAWQDDEVNARYAAVRDRLNEDWPVFNGEPAMETLMWSGRRPLSGVRSLVLLTDGLLLPGAKTDIEGAIAAAMQIDSYGISAYYQSLKKLYHDDPERTKFPRFKMMDDASGILLRLQADPALQS